VKKSSGAFEVQVGLIITYVKCVSVYPLEAFTSISYPLCSKIGKTFL